MKFEERLKYLEENYDGLASMVLQDVMGGVQCKTMSYQNCYLKCIDRLLEILKERPELLESTASTERKG